MEQTSPPHPGWNLGKKMIFGLGLTVVAGVLGYLLVYWWVFYDFKKVLDVNVLKSQVISVQKANDVKSQLEGLGYEFSDYDFYQLNKPGSTNYRANVLDGYEPVKVEEDEAKEDAYYFYDKNDTPYFFTVDEENQIDPESLIPLITD